MQHVLADSTADHQFAADRRRAYRDGFGVSGLRVMVKQPDSRWTPGFFVANFSVVAQFDVSTVGWYNCQVEFWGGSDNNRRRYGSVKIALAVRNLGSVEFVDLDTNRNRKLNHAVLGLRSNTVFDLDAVKAGRAQSRP